MTTQTFYESQIYFPTSTPMQKKKNQAAQAQNYSVSGSKATQVCVLCDPSDTRQDLHLSHRTTKLKLEYHPMTRRAHCLTVLLCSSRRWLMRLCVWEKMKKKKRIWENTKWKKKDNGKVVLSWWMGGILWFQITFHFHLFEGKLPPLKKGMVGWRRARSEWAWRWGGSYRVKRISGGK